MAVVHQIKTASKSKRRALIASPSLLDQLEQIYHPPNPLAGARRADAKKHLSKQTVVTF